MATDPIPVTGAHFSRDRQGLVRIELPFIVAGPGDEGTDDPWETLYSWLPDSLPMGLPLVERPAQKEDNGDWRLTLVFEGVPSGGDTAILLEIDHAGVEDPIESFPLFEQLKKKYPAVSPGSDKQFLGWTPTMPDPASGQTVHNPLYGTSSFLNDNAVLRISFLRNKFDPALLANICKIQDPTPLLPKGMAATDLVTGATTTPSATTPSWLKRTVRGQWRGNVWFISVEFYLGVWVPEIYTATFTGTNLTGPDLSQLPDTMVV